MKKTLVALLIVCAVIAVALEVAERAVRSRASRVLASSVTAAAVPAKPVRPVRVGEKIVYDVKMGALKMGTAVYEQVAGTVVRERAADCFTFETRLLRFVDRERIFSDPETALPVRVERDISIWPKHEVIVEEYDQKNFTVVLKKGGRTDTITSAGPLQNAILLPFSIRERARLEPGWSARVNLPTQKFEITLTGTERVRVPAGEFEAYHFISVPEKFEVWVTKDEKRVPVKIKGTGAIGYTLFMSSYNPPTAAVAGDQAR